ncbi:enoyl-CoA hydratase [Oceaniglobus indicus]|uniref:enoyl-CoA hydratase n=1 Tax=Oceaniglobus indicus TaxID=2047749 RepID=UPI000C17D089|nr:enoyl-CoA hydratase [Oceaniglobus indicus]
MADTTAARTHDLADGRIVVTAGVPVGRILFNQPAKLNAMSLAMWAGLSDALALLGDDGAVRVVVLSGAGDRAFVSGADISEFGEQRSGDAAVADYNRTSEAAERQLCDFAKPTIAMIRGVCVGGGMALALACDLRICADDARLGITAGKMGLGYGLDAVTRLVDTVGPSVAAEVLYTATLFNADRARAMGLVNHVVPVDALGAEVEALAGRIAANAPLTIAAAKAAIRAAQAENPDHDHVARMVAACYASADYIEGRTAFLEKRPPVFRGR